MAKCAPNSDASALRGLPPAGGARVRRATAGLAALDHRGDQVVLVSEVPIISTSSAGRSSC